ncbi:MAG: ATPase, T2SS/T4P/T4SS family [bacterium]
MSKVFEQKKLGEILTEAEIISRPQLNKALEAQKSRSKKLGQILVSMGYTDEEIVMSLLGKQLNSAYVKLSEHGEIEDEVIRSIPEGIARQNILIPIEKDSRTLKVAMAEPQNDFVKDILHLITGFDIKAFISSEREIKTAIDENYKNIKSSGARCLPLSELGFDDQGLAIYTKAIESKSGLVLIAGPKGSGKSTTLYSTLNALNMPDRNIISLEDSIECILDGINQVEMKPELGLNFSSGLRKCLESLDADIIVVGEIKDVQTARLAVTAAEMGHLVFCVVNTDELSTMDRLNASNSLDSQRIIEFLINIGIESYLVSSTLRMIVTQRLLRSICPDCRQVYTPPADMMETMGLSVHSELNLYKGRGCKSCNYSGFGELTGCFEVFTMNETMQDLIIEGFSPESIRQASRDFGIISLQKAGVHKVLGGQTTINEMLRVIDIAEPQHLIEDQQAVLKDATDMYWDIFEMTGSIDALLLSRGRVFEDKTSSVTKPKKSKRSKKTKRVRAS